MQQDCQLLPAEHDRCRGHEAVSEKVTCNTEALTIVAAGIETNGSPGGVPSSTFILPTTTVFMTASLPDPGSIATGDDLNAAIGAFGRGGPGAGKGRARGGDRYCLSAGAGARSTIDLTAPLRRIDPMAGSSLTILGEGATIDGRGTYAGSPSAPAA